MKKNIILSLLLNLFFNLSYSQMAVVDAGSNMQLNNLNVQLQALNQNIMKLNATSDASKLETTITKELTNDQLSLEKLTEKALWEVPAYLKKGEKIKSILNKEQKVISGVQSLGNYLNSNNIPNSIRNSVMKQAYSYLNSTGSLVDSSLNILTDNFFRMEIGDRKNYLDEIDETLSAIVSQINTLKSSMSSYVSGYNSQQTYKSNYNKALQKIKD